MSIRAAMFLCMCVLCVSCSEEQLREAATFEEEPRAFKGVWLFEFEGSTFLEGAEKAPEIRPSYSEASWLDYEPPESAGDYGYDQDLGCYSITAFHVEFLGVKKTPLHGAGHFGLWDSEIEVLDMRKIERIASPDCTNF